VAVKDVSTPDFEFTLARFITFQDQAECQRVREIDRMNVTTHANPLFKIKVVEDRGDFYGAFAGDLVSRIRDARDHGRRLVVILPVGPMPQYALAARAINEQGLSLDHVHIFMMDEYADQDGNTAPSTWRGSFAGAFLREFVERIESRLRMPITQVHFPTKQALASYARQIDDLGGVDVCYGGIGWCGHIAFWESNLAEEFGNDLAAFAAAGPRLVELHPMTIMQNALHSFGGDWSQVPPRANTIGPAQIVEARHRSFWLDGDLGGGYSWQRFIARLVAHGPVTPAVPGSILQTLRTDYTMLGSVASNIHITMG
jgi:glucosamine-6-phosphate deaminase